MTMADHPTFAFDAVVLAGGQSSRMGTDKALLPHPSTKQPLLIRQLKLITDFQPTQRFVSAHHGQQLPELPCGITRMDDSGSEGPLVGIIAALQACTEEHLFVLAVDLPAMTLEVLVELRSHLTSPGVGVYAQTPDGPEPLVSFLPRRLGADLETAFRRGERSPRKLFAEVLSDRMRPVPFAETAPFRNWNRPSDI